MRQEKGWNLQQPIRDIDMTITLRCFHLGSTLMFGIQGAFLGGDQQDLIYNGTAYRGKFGYFWSRNMCRAAAGRLQLNWNEDLSTVSRKCISSSCTANCLACQLSVKMETKMTEIDLRDFYETQPGY